MYPSIPVSIIQISSDSATFRATDPGFSAYCASKFGVGGFSDVLFKELRDYGIKVCQIMPNWVNTPMAEKFFVGHEKLLDKMIQMKDIWKTVEYILKCSENVCPLEMLIFPQYNVERQAKL